LVKARGGGDTGVVDQAGEGGEDLGFRTSRSKSNDLSVGRIEDRDEGGLLGLVEY